jgi:hypothetical protein
MDIRTVKRFFTIFAKPLLCGPGFARAKNKKPLGPPDFRQPQGLTPVKTCPRGSAAGFISDGILSIKSHRVNSMYNDIDVLASDSTVVITGATWLK